MQRETVINVTTFVYIDSILLKTKMTQPKTP